MTYVVLVTGLSSNSLSRFMQIAGILASLVSVAKTCMEFHIYTSFNLKNGDRQIPLNMLLMFKAMLFFAPHVVFRTIATAFVVAFLKLYSLVPLMVYTLINSVMDLL